MTEAPPSGWRAPRCARLALGCLIAVVALGVGLRFNNLGGKPYWFDEVVTSLRVSGLWEEDVYQELGRSPQLFKAGDFQRYQSPQPGTTWRRVVSGLAREEPQHLPLYYVLSRFWAEAFGGSPVVLRSLSALLSVLGFPCAFWLGKELFGSYWVAWIALALFASSPFEVLQAQTAREYGFWVTVTLLSSAALLRALRKRTTGAWLVYALSTALAMQTFLFTALIVAGQAKYVFSSGRVWRAHERQGAPFGTTVVPFLAAAASALLTIVPWLLGIESPDQVEGTTSWSEVPRSVGAMLKAYAAGLLRLFFDINSQSTAGRTELVLAALLTLLVAALFCAGVREIWRRRKDEHGALALLLIAGNALPLGLHDFLLGGQLSAAPRLLAPAYAAVHFVVARALASPERGGRRLAAAAVLIVLFPLGIFSNLVSTRAEAWWNKDPNNVNVNVARVLRSAERPLLVSDGWPEDMFSLAYWLDPATPVFGQFLAYQGHPVGPQVDVRLPASTSEVFYFNARPYTQGVFRAWLQMQRAQGRAEPVVNNGDFTVLWKLTPQ
jgi:uncharacterized membrane protein